MFRLNWPVTPKDLVRASLKDAESKDWEGLVSHGHGAIDFRHDPMVIAGTMIRPCLVPTDLLKP